MIRDPTPQDTSFRWVAVTVGASPEITTCPVKSGTVVPVAAAVRPDIGFDDIA
jgi:hypothetical protein